MGPVCISLLGKFEIKCEGRSITGLETKKAQELLAYLLFNRRRPHCRDKLANLLWENSSPSKSKSYLRQTLWQVQTALSEENPLLRVDAEWIQIDETIDYWFDVACIERAYALSQDIQGKNLEDQIAVELEQAVSLYRGELLENWYQEWCLIERERLQNMYLTMLEKLVGYYKAHRRYNTATTYAMQILRCDPAHERTYRRLMRLNYLAGNRTAALRTYERCVAILAEELGVAPGWRTIALHKQIQADQIQKLPPLAEEPTLAAKLDRVLRLQRTLLQTQEQVSLEIEAIRKALHQ